ncbi:MAG: 4-hydroxy-tetrahydrodipicolinate synthase [Pseudomonadota bacterium]
MFHGSLVALVTPFDRRGQVDYGAFDALLDRHVAAGTRGVVVAGTTGESATLSLAERTRLTERAVVRVGDRVNVLAGSGTNSTATSISTSRAIAAAGAHGALVVTPYYNKPSQRGLEEHYLRIADAVDIGLMMYNVPGRTSVDLVPDTVARLATHPNIVAIKEATGSLSRAEQIVAACAGQLELLSGDDATFVDAMAIGAAGVVSVTANVAPGQMQAVCDAARAGDFTEAVNRNAPLEALHDALLLESNPMAVKCVLSRLGWCGATLRLPLVPLDPANEPTLLAACHAAGIEITEAETA